MGTGVRGGKRGINGDAAPEILDARRGQLGASHHQHLVHHVKV